MKYKENLHQEKIHTPEALAMRHKNNDRGSSTHINTVITTHFRLKHKDDIDSCPHENAVNTSKSELSDISMQIGLQVLKEVELVPQENCFLNNLCSGVIQK